MEVARYPAWMCMNKTMETKSERSVPIHKQNEVRNTCCNNVVLTLGNKSDVLIPDLEVGITVLSEEKPTIA